jgi:hypothetical protein
MLILSWYTNIQTAAIHIYATFASAARPHDHLNIIRCPIEGFAFHPGGGAPPTLLTISEMELFHMHPKCFYDITMHLTHAIEEWLLHEYPWEQVTLHHQ